MKSIWHIMEAEAYKQTGWLGAEIVFGLFFHAQVSIWIGPERFVTIIFKARETDLYYREDYECHYEDALVIGEKIE